jgi:hypothetical protein
VPGWQRSRSRVPVPAAQRLFAAMIVRHFRLRESGKFSTQSRSSGRLAATDMIGRCQMVSPRRVVARQRGEEAVGSILTFVPKIVFDDVTTRIMSAAFDAACKELHDTGQPLVVQEVMAERIIDAARSGERDLIRLRDAALTALDAAKRRR